MGRGCGQIRCWSAATKPNCANWRRLMELTRVSTDLGGMPGRSGEQHLFRRADHVASGARGGGRHPRGQACVLRKACRGLAGRRGKTGKTCGESRCKTRGRAGQAFPARNPKIEAIDRRRILRQDLFGARRIRLLGVRRRLATGAAAIVELSRRGRRRHSDGHAFALALCAGSYVWSRETSQLRGGDAYPEALGRSRQAVRMHRRGRRLRDF